MNTLKAVLLRGIFQIFNLIPVRLAGGLGAGLGRLAFYLDKRHRSISIRNVTRVYPQKPRNWRIRIARESFAELGRSMLELPHVFLRSKEFLASRVIVEGEDELRTALAGNKGVFVAACHHGNWEFGALMFSLLGYDIEFFYRPVRQQVVDDYLRLCRERFGARLHARQEPLRWVMRALKEKKVVGLMIDQHIGDGIPVPFLGHMASALTLPAIMVRKYEAPIVGVVLERLGRDFRFRLKLWRIETPVGSKDTDAYTYRLTRDIGKSFEPIINLRPEMWLWSHQRWKLLEEREKDISEVVYGTP